MSLLSVKDLRVEYPVRQGILREPGLVQAVAGVSFEIGAGETLGLVGESGCGKSSLARALVRLVKVRSGQVLLEGRDILKLGGEALRQTRRHIQIIFQDPFNSLDPRMTLAQTIGEALEAHQWGDSESARRARIAELLKSVGLDAASQAHRYPHEFSGGQRQRIGIARALAVEPKLMICDEPVSALDVSVQAQIINLLKDLQQRHGMACLFIAHDLAVVGHLSHRVMVMYLGRIVESAEAGALLQSPRHPYTQALISAAPSLDAATRRQRIVLSGEAPSPLEPPQGCPFHTRCPRAVFPRCGTEMPLLAEVAPGHKSACHFAGEF
jgi:oligopeptide transport system ATP-binding protein